MGPLVLISMVLLLITVAWSLYAEFYGLRPWRSYQAGFQSVFSGYLNKQIASRRTAEQQFQASPDYKRLTAAVQAATAAAASGDKQILAQVDLLDRQRAAITPSFQDARGRVGSLVYQLEQVPETDKSGRESGKKPVLEARAVTYDVDWPTEQGIAP